MRSSKKIIEKIGQVYSALVSKHGIDPKSGGYHDEIKRELRYDRLSQIVNEFPDKFTIAELGCGYGAFYDYLDEKFPGRILHYYGYDISDEMVRVGRDYLAQRPATISKESCVIEEVDYVFISGIFNVNNGADAQEWWYFMQECLGLSFIKARKGLAFNVLSDAKVDFKSKSFFYANTEMVRNFVAASLSPNFFIDENYPLYEMTVSVYRLDGAS